MSYIKYMKGDLPFNCTHFEKLLTSLVELDEERDIDIDDLDYSEEDTVIEWKWKGLIERFKKAPYDQKLFDIICTFLNQEDYEDYEKILSIYSSNDKISKDILSMFLEIIAYNYFCYKEMDNGNDYVTYKFSR